MANNNTGYKQAIVAYKVSQPGNKPLDIEGILTEISGKKQAIALLKGRTNPDETLYEVAFFFDPGGEIGGNPTIQYNPESCPVSDWVLIDGTWDMDGHWYDFELWYMEPT